MELNTNEETIYRNEETLNESDSNQSTRYSTNGFPEQFQQRLWLEAALNNINESKKIVQKYSLYITLQMVTAISILLQGTWFFQVRFKKHRQVRSDPFICNCLRILPKQVELFFFQKKVN